MNLTTCANVSLCLTMSQIKKFSSLIPKSKARHHTNMCQLLFFWPHLLWLLLRNIYIDSLYMKSTLLKKEILQFLWEYSFIAIWLLWSPVSLQWKCSTVQSDSEIITSLWVFAEKEHPNTHAILHISPSHRGFWSRIVAVSAPNTHHNCYRQNRCSGNGGGERYLLRRRERWR